METYQALEIKTLYSIYEMWDKDISCWILYRTNKKSNVNIKLKCSVEPLIQIKNVLPESLHCILYKPGEYYQLENLTKQIEQNQIDIDQLLLKAGLDINACDRLLLDLESTANQVWTTPKRKEIFKIAANTNGFCVFYPIKTKESCINGFWCNNKIRRIKVFYRPNSKKLYKESLDMISCHINLSLNKFDYKQYFFKTLEDKQMLLNKEESLMLYHTLEENVEEYFLEGGKALFLKQGYSSEPELLYDNKEIQIEEKTIQELFLWWITGKLERNLNQSILFGLL